MRLCGLSEAVGPEPDTRDAAAAPGHVGELPGISARSGAPAGGADVTSCDWRLLALRSCDVITVLGTALRYCITWDDAELQCNLFIPADALCRTSVAMPCEVAAAARAGAAATAASASAAVPVRAGGRPHDLQQQHHQDPSPGVGGGRSARRRGASSQHAPDSAAVAASTPLSYWPPAAAPPGRRQTTGGALPGAGGTAACLGRAWGRGGFGGAPDAFLVTRRGAAAGVSRGAARAAGSLLRQPGVHQLGGRQRGGAAAAELRAVRHGVVLRAGVPAGALGGGAQGGVRAGRQRGPALIRDRKGGLGKVGGYEGS
jgi:hypothetical protein